MPIALWQHGLRRRVNLLLLANRHAPNRCSGSEPLSMGEARPSRVDDYEEEDEYVDVPVEEPL